MVPRLASALAHTIRWCFRGVPRCENGPSHHLCSPFSSATPLSIPPLYRSVQPPLAASLLPLLLSRSAHVSRRPFSALVHAAVLGFLLSLASRTADARPFGAGHLTPHRFQSSLGTLRSPSHALPHSLTPQGDSTGRSGCPRGPRPDWPVLHSYVPNARLSPCKSPPRVIKSQPTRKSTVHHTNHTRSLLCRLSRWSTLESLSTKRKPSRRASSPWPLCAARTAPPTTAKNWRLLSCLVRTHEPIA